MEKFSFNGAFMHFMKAEGPKGFIWKFILSYTLAFTLLYGVMFGVIFKTMWPIFENLEGTQDPKEIFAIMGMMMGIGLLLTPFYLAVLSMFEAAALRRYIRHEGFSLRFGADEWRTVAVLLIWGGIFFVAYLLLAGPIVAIVIPAVTSVDQGDTPGWIFAIIPVFILLWFAAFFVGIIFSIRFCAASALTLRDRKIQFRSAWRVSRGKFWPIFGAYLAIYAISYVIQMVVQMISMAFMMGAMFSNMDKFTSEDPASMNAMMFSGPMLIPVILLTIMAAATYAFLHYAFLGIPAKLALTDPTWSGNPTLAETFD